MVYHLLILVKKNTHPAINPRRCPAGVWAVNMDAELIKTIYSNFSIKLNHLNPEKKPFEVMRVPKEPFLITLRPVAKVHTMRNG